jgi:F-type H+-transporting ATPase subunit b
MIKFLHGFWLVLSGILLLAFSADDLWANTGGIGGEIFWQIISFVLLLLLLAYALKNPVQTFLRKRQGEIKNSLDESARKEKEAQIDFENWQEKLNSLRQEIDDLHRKISLEGEVERKRITERAAEEGDRIRKQAQMVAEREIRKAQATLRMEMVDLSIKLAERILQELTQSQDQERLVREYIGKMREFR